jgi:hypothetical protein
MGTVFIAPQWAMNRNGEAPVLMSAASAGQTDKTRRIIGIYSSKYKPATANVGKIASIRIYVDLFRADQQKAIQFWVFQGIGRGFN